MENLEFNFYDCNGKNFEERVELPGYDAADAHGRQLSKEWGECLVKWAEQGSTDWSYSHADD